MIRSLPTSLFKSLIVADFSGVCFISSIRFLSTAFWTFVVLFCGTRCTKTLLIKISGLFFVSSVSSFIRGSRPSFVLLRYSLLTSFCLLGVN